MAGSEAGAGTEGDRRPPPGTAARCCAGTWASALAGGRRRREGGGLSRMMLGSSDWWFLFFRQKTQKQQDRATSATIPPAEAITAMMPFPRPPLPLSLSLEDAVPEEASVEESESEGGVDEESLSPLFVPVVGGDADALPSSAPPVLLEPAEPLELGAAGAAPSPEVFLDDEEPP